MALILLSEKEGTSYNRKTDTEYVYLNSTYFDDELQKRVYKRKVVGKIDRETGERVPTGSVGRPRTERPAYEATAAGTTSEQAGPETQRENRGTRIDPRDAQAILRSLSALSAELARLQKVLEDITAESE